MYFIHINVHINIHINIDIDININIFIPHSGNKTTVSVFD